jgi:sarcosine oxidase subunit gamma
MTLVPDSLPRRSFLYRELAALGARFEEVAGAACAMDYGDGEGELAAARRLGLCDLSPLPRCGVKGRAALDWLRGQGLEIGANDNLAYPQSDGVLVARLAPTEAVLLSDLGAGADFAFLIAACTLEAAPGAYPVPRAGSSAWLRVTGSESAAMFAKLCGVDLRPAKFPKHAIAQTSIARLNGIVVRADLGETLAYHLLADSASASYLWSCLLDAMAEFDGRPVGLDALRRLND